MVTGISVWRSRGPNVFSFNPWLTSLGLTIFLPVFLFAQNEQDRSNLLAAGISAYGESKYEVAKVLFLQVDSLLVHEEVDSISAQAYYWLGRICYVQRQGKEGVKWLESAGKWYQAHPGGNPKLPFKTYEWLGNVYRYTLQDPFRALPYFEKALILWESNPDMDADGERRLTYNLAATYRLMRETEKAIIFGERSLRLAKHEPNNQTQLASQLNLMGVILMTDRQPQKAASFFKESLAILPREPSLLRRELRYSSNLADAYRDLGQLTFAEDLQLDNLRILTEMKEADPYLLGNTYYVLGKISRQIGDLNNFDRYLRKAIETYIQAYQDPPAIVAEMYAYSSWVHEADPGRSLLLADSALQILWPDWFADKNPGMPFPSQTQWELLFTALGRRAKALRNLAVRDGTSLEEAMHYHDLSLEAYQWYRLSFLQQRSASNQAEEYGWLLEEALETVVLALSKVNETEVRKQLFSLAWKAIEIGKSFSLHQQFMAYQANTLDLLPDEIFWQYKDLMRKQRLYIRTDKQDSLYMNDRQLSQWHERIRTTFPAYSKYVLQTNLYALERIRETIPFGDVLINYLEGEQALYAVVVDKEKTVLRKIGTIEWSRNHKTYLEFLRNTTPENVSLIQAKSAIRSGHDLFQQLIEPALSDSSSGLIILPHGRLESLPFEALLTAKNPAQPLAYQVYPYLIRQQRIQYAYSGAHWYHVYSQSLDETSHEQTEMAGFAWGNQSGQMSLPALPASEDEVISVAKIWEGDTYVGGEAQESRFRAALQNHQILHVATHGVADVSSRIDPRLIFPTKETGHDGVLHLHELLDLNITSDLVVLSACETSEGTFNVGEGLRSISRGFAWAGCPSIISNLWPSYDQSASVIMQELHRSIRKGEALATALQRSKLKYLSSATPLEGHPSRWAGVVLQGMYKTPVQESNALFVLISLTVCFLIILIKVFLSR